MPKTLQELFVDRSRQCEAFRKMLDGQSRRRIMVLTAGPGMGKSWLLQIFAQEARTRKLPLAQIDFADGLAYDALLLMRRCRDALGAEHFNALTQAINEATTARLALTTDGGAPAPAVSVSIGAESSLADSPVSVSEVGTIVKDNYFVLQTDNPLIRQVIEDRINTAFFDCVVRLCAQTMMVFLFDSYERTSLEADRWAPSAADRWISGQLLARIRSGEIANAVVVLAGRRAPEFGVEWNEVLGRMSLEPLECTDITEYLRVRRGLTVLTDAEATRLCQAVGGSPQVLGLIGDNLEQANRPRAQDDEW
jgi:hypothetical protein